MNNALDNFVNNLEDNHFLQDILANKKEIKDRGIPFVITKDQAVKKYRKYCKLYSLIPLAAIKKEVLENVRKVYIPIYDNDFLVSGDVLLDALDIEKQWEDKEFKYEEVKKYSVRYTCKLEFKSWLALRSKNFDSNLLEKLKPFDTNIVNDIAGNDFEILDANVAEEEIVSDEQRLLLGRCLRKVRTFDNHKKTKVSFNNLVIKQLRKDSILLPVYLFSFKYKNRDYTVGVNGQNGKVVGSVPKSFGKLCVISIIIFTLTFIISFLIAYFV